MKHNKKMHQDLNDRNIADIQAVAANPKLINTVHKELTYEQARGIYIRHRQLRQENKVLKRATLSKKTSQIEYCYKQRREGRDNKK